MPVTLVEFAHTIAQGQIMRPGSKPGLGAGAGIIAIDDCCVERRNMGRVQEVQEVGNRGPQTLDGQCIDCPDRRKDLCLFVAAATPGQQASEGPLVFRALVDVRNTQLGLPQEGVVGTLEDLALLGDGMDNRLKRGAAISDAKAAGFNLGNNLLDAPADRTKILMRWSHRNQLL